MFVMNIIFLSVSNVNFVLQGMEEWRCHWVQQLLVPNMDHSAWDKVIVEAASSLWSLPCTHHLVVFHIVIPQAAWDRWTLIIVAWIPSGILTEVRCVFKAGGHSLEKTSIHQWLRHRWGRFKAYFLRNFGMLTLIFFLQITILVEKEKWSLHPRHSFCII